MSVLTVAIHFFMIVSFPMIDSAYRKAKKNAMHTKQAAWRR